MNIWGNVMTLIHCVCWDSSMSPEKNKVVLVYNNVCFGVQNIPYILIFQAFFLVLTSSSIVVLSFQLVLLLKYIFVLLYINIHL